MEEDWIVDRARLRELMSKHPRLTQRELADQVGRSVGWVKKWRQRLRAVHPNDDQVLHRRTSPRCRPRTRRTARIVERVLDIRDHPVVSKNLVNVPVSPYQRRSCSHG